MFSYFACSSENGPFTLESINCVQSEVCGCIKKVEEKNLVSLYAESKIGRGGIPYFIQYYLVE